MFLKFFSWFWKFFDKILIKKKNSSKWLSDDDTVPCHKELSCTMVAVGLLAAAMLASTWPPRAPRMTTCRTQQPPFKAVAGSHCWHFQSPAFFYFLKLKKKKALLFESQIFLGNFFFLYFKFDCKILSYFEFIFNVFIFSYRIFYFILYLMRLNMINLWFVI